MILSLIWKAVMVMSRIEELIQIMCPNGANIIQTQMGDVLTFLNGRAYKQEELLTEGKYPVLRVGNFYTNDNWYYSDLEVSEDKYCDNGDLLYSWAATLGPKVWCGGKCIFHYHIWKILFDESILDKKYLYYYLQYDLNSIRNSTTSSTMIHVSMSSMKKRKIEIPPLKIQKEIVAVLDKFTELEVELQHELKARKKQYEYYRDKLLTFSEDVEYRKIIEIADTYTGLTYKPENVTVEGTLVLRSSNIQNSTLAFNDNVYVKMENIPERAIARENDILVCVRNGSSALIGKAAIIPAMDNKMTFGAFMTVMRAKEGIDYRFLYHSWLSSKVQKLIHGDNAMPINQITKKDFERIYIQVPPLKEQERIADILDKFADICQSTQIGLPAEIEARHKQYEYYRDKLLTFERKVV